MSNRNSFEAESLNCQLIMPLCVYRFSSDKVRHHLSHVLQQQRIGHAVARLRVEHQLKLLPCLLQLINKLHRVLHVHVVVDRAVNQQQLAVQDLSPRVTGELFL